MRTQSLSMVSGLLLGLAALGAAAQEPAPAATAEKQREEPQVLLAGPVDHGGFGGPMVAYTRVASQDTVAVGGRGGWLIDHRLVLGGGGWGIAGDVRPPAGAVVTPSAYRLEFGYGGFWTEYIVAPLRPVHASLGVLVGAGGVTYRRTDGMELVPRDDVVFVLEPAVGVEANLTSFMRLGLFGTYRMVRGVELAALDNGDMSGFGGGLLLKFGRF